MKTCEAFNIKNFEDFHNLYLKRDVYGLCDVFEYLREISMEARGLDPTPTPTPTPTSTPTHAYSVCR